MALQSRVTILVKASPQPSKRHSETVCCAGLQEDGTWKRLFPIRFRRLSGEKAFSRWDIVNFEYSRPRDDNRQESCRVHEESIQIVGQTKRAEEKSSLIERAVLASEKEAIDRNLSLALIRPTDVTLTWQKLTEKELETDRQNFAEQAKQLSFLEDEIAAYEPCPYRFKMRYRDEAGEHTKTCADWETSAAFFNLRQSMPESDILRHLEKTYCENYVKKGLVLALGNMKRRPQTWQLLGVFPIERPVQRDLFSS
ncbi:hypothetical protein PhaeoP23_02210 [Phaeobacter piscinae]|uniref:Uncharacterized protein n=1 Tax=Phaeobacter piscinae TaxID=1580596 RepID=A0ABM6PFA7_9RHOB|nr:hypothetical protein [Phaeobacter piscinae]ATG36335.1 hypothetical protein PhaeoP36_02210 [Phaeobacter piscinae]AUQ86856.1 hypothetical protein PhaeoP42_02211 [Phaeobacter piscinae]AUR24739.1 hypothetical protein PhaeoP23_02210 [Phaeobacter piscinae]